MKIWKRKSTDQASDVATDDSPEVDEEVAAPADDASADATDPADERDAVEESEEPDETAAPEDPDEPEEAAEGDDDDDDDDDLNLRIDKVTSSATVTEGEEPIEVVGNTWIIGDDEDVLVVDPGTDAEAVRAAVGDRQVLAVICTNGTAEQVSAAVAVAEPDEAPVAVHRRDRLLWRETHADTDIEIQMEDGGVFEVAEVGFHVIHTPGYTPGTVCLYSEDADLLLSGAALLASGPADRGDGFADFPTQLTSIGEKLLNLPGETRVLPARGEETTIGEVEPRFDSWVAHGTEIA